MYTEKELQISNKSYTDKDFQSIFPELLDLVKKLTNKWDPSSSNESDPGVVLLKLGALLADKNNYNIDKNILETFPLSVTQRANAWKLYDMLGYSMGWYKAAVTDITVTYTGTHFEDESNTSPIIVPRYTMFTDDSGQTTYTLIEDLYFNEVSIPATGQALQGTIHDYEVNGVTDITLDNLDSEFRLFFNDKMIAQNGIFITNKGSIDRDWRITDNLEAETLNSAVYKFGIIPNTDTCYIQFPQDVGNLIGGGLNIKYIITSGLAGNVKANVINSFLNDFVISGSGPINDDFIIKNSASTSSGSDPEDIDSAYRNYKKTIGTFDTLVTIRDYENAIRRAEDGYGRPYVSNAVVSDRTCDLNYTTKVVELTTQGNQINTYVTKNDDGLPYMDAFSIGLYVLNPSAEIYDSSYYYNKSFCPIQQQQDIRAKIEDYKVSSHDYINQELGNPYIYKNFYTLVGKVHTYYKVTEAQAEEIEDNIKMALYKKYNARNVDFGQPVNYDDLLNTVQQADTRIKTVLLAEPEYQLRYSTGNDVVGDFKNSKPLVDQDLILRLLARMILAGNVQLYKFDADVVYRFGQTNIQKYPRVTKIKPLNKLNGTDIDNFAGGGYVVKKNQNIQLVAPNLYVEKSYVSYVNYALVDSASNKVEASYDTDNEKWVVEIDDIPYEIGVTVDGDGGVVDMYLSNGGSMHIVSFDIAQDLDGYVSGKVEVVGAEGTLITARMLAKYEITEGQFNILSIEFSYGEGTFVINQGSYYRLKESQSIYINYTDSNGKNVDDVIRGGTIVRFTDNTNGTSKLSTAKITIDKDTIDGQSIGFSTLSASQQIDVLAVNKQTKKDRKLYCLWFTNDYDKVYGSDTIVYTLFKDNQKERILQDNEYFIYTDERKNELVMLGSGTIIQRQNFSSSLQTSIKIKISDVISDGLSAVDDDTDWYTYNASENNLTFIETQVVTLGEGSIVKATISEEDEDGLKDGKPVKVTAVKYKSDNQASTAYTRLTEYEIGGDGIYQGVYCGWTLYTKINLMVGKDFPQELSSGDSIVLSCINDEGEEEQKILTGGGGVKLLSNSVLAFSGGSEVSIVSNDGSDINIYRYEDDGLPLELSYNDDDTITLNYDSFIKATDDVKFQFSFGNDVFDSGVYTCRKYRIPVTFVGKYTEVTIEVIGGSSDDTYTIDSTNNVEFIEFTDTTSSKFGGLHITNWDKNDDNVNDSDIKDFIRIEGIYVSKVSDTYSEQLNTTISEFYGSNANEKVQCVVDMIKQGGSSPSISNGNTFKFNETYIVPETDKIDTDIASEKNLNNLFASNAVWDVNHICNKFTIPQLNTDTLNIKVAASSIK